MFARFLLSGLALLALLALLLKSLLLVLVARQLCGADHHSTT